MLHGIKGKKLLKHILNLSHVLSALKVESKILLFCMIILYIFYDFYELSQYAHKIKFTIIINRINSILSIIFG